MRNFTLGLLSAAAVATTFLLMRQQQRQLETLGPRVIPPGEAQPARLSLERIRELGL